MDFSLYGVFKRTLYLPRCFFVVFGCINTTRSLPPTNHRHKATTILGLIFTNLKHIQKLHSDPHADPLPSSHRSASTCVTSFNLRYGPCVWRHNLQPKSLPYHLRQCQPLVCPRSRHPYELWLSFSDLYLSSLLLKKLTSPSSSSAFEHSHTRVLEFLAVEHASHKPPKYLTCLHALNWFFMSFTC